MAKSKQFHMYLVSDATGGTLHTVAQAAAAYYGDYECIEHTYVLVRNEAQLNPVLKDIAKIPGVLFYTITDPKVRQILEDKCKQLEMPAVAILDPVITCLENFLGVPARPHIGGQYALDATYFKRMDALNYTLVHDDGQHPEGLEEADVVLVGVSRSSKTPTSIYLAHRGIKTANVPFIPDIPLPIELDSLKKPLVVGLVAGEERLFQIRRNRLVMLNDKDNSSYADREEIAREVNLFRRICVVRNWPIVDVTRRSVEETAAAILRLRTRRSI